MKKQTVKKLILIIAVLCFALASAFSVTYIAAFSNHNCTGVNCAVCREIQYAYSFLSGIKYLLFSVFFGFICLFVFGIIRKELKKNERKTSLITLKVKLSD